MASTVSTTPVTYDFNKLNELCIKFEETFSKKITSIDDIYIETSFNEFKGSDQKIFQFELLELVKLQKLTKARVTKFGLLLSEFYKKQDNEIKCFLEKVAKALYEEYFELQNNFYYTISVLKCIKKLEIKDDESKTLERVGYPSLMIKNIEESIFALYTVLKDTDNLYKKYLSFNDNIKDKKEADLTLLNDEKLLLIGKVWAINDHLVSLSNNWKQLYTSLLTNFGTKLIEDIMEEINEFKENPEDFINQNDDDPFGINIDYDSEEEEKEDETLTNEKAEEIEKSKEIFDNNFINKLKLIKLLLATSKKFIKDITDSQLEKDGNTIYLNLNEIIKTTKEIVKQLDTITIEIMENQVYDLSELNPLVNSFKSELKSISNNNKNFEKFIVTWNIKYNE